MPKRLIDANALLSEYCQANGCNEVIDEVCPNCFTAGLIANAPTVEAVEVVHGRTEVIEPFEVTLTARCCLCGVAMGNLDNFCPNCGAKMDGERKDNEGC